MKLSKWEKSWTYKENGGMHCSWSDAGPCDTWGYDLAILQAMPASDGGWLYQLNVEHVMENSDNIDLLVMDWHHMSPKKSVGKQMAELAIRNLYVRRKKTSHA